MINNVKSSIFIYSQSASFIIKLKFRTKQESSMNRMFSSEWMSLSLVIKRKRKNKPWTCRAEQGSASISNNCFLLLCMSLLLTTVKQGKRMTPFYLSSNGSAPFGLFSESTSFAFKLSPESLVLSFRSCLTVFPSSWKETEREVQYLI